MPAVPAIIAVASVVSAGVGIAEMIQGFGNAPDKPDAPPSPDANKAKIDASNTVANQRQILLASGGQTDFTGGLGVLTGADVSKTTLVGG